MDALLSNIPDMDIAVEQEPSVHEAPAVELPVMDVEQSAVESAPVEAHPEQVDGGAVEEEPLALQIEEGLAKAKHRFRAETEQELGFSKHQEITLLRKIDENWYEGEIEDRIGIFPSNYVEVIKEPRIVETVPSQSIQTIIDAANEVADTATDNAVEAPPSPVEQDDAEMEEVNGEDIEDLLGKGIPHRVLYDYEQSCEDDLALVKGEVVHVIQKCDDGWYIGTDERTRKIGTFPGNYVKEL